MLVIIYDTEESRCVSLGTDTKCQNNHKICALHLKYNGENVIENKNNHLEVAVYYIYDFKIIMDKSAKRNLTHYKLEKSLHILLTRRKLGYIQTHIDTDHITY